ncbi:hypothetical protein A3C33_03040 [Candidatus Curtissbacteria bacterium RIFCSPHIGHO2_02_FULL_42_58]|nr:MAG: hypothetical protein A3C33_03040 [Candidatus Curtissbacteria bacterium RIFCSPHIGHO2_02_FULL_42_58]OGD97780.1 MAG: hypothetical protein A3E71_03550 [Candidatus Curtissbacteria bacterium RIFCSPHIGHO2_12_FULL_42_33]
MRLREMILTISDFVAIWHPLSVGTASALALFLFWRAGRHELLDSEFIFDIAIICGVGAFLGARVFDFVINPGLYQWSVNRLLFFNAYGGFDFYGGLFGAMLFAALYLRSSKVSFWYIFDLAAAPLVFGMALAALFSLNREGLYHFLGYFVIFVILKRLATQKRHVGFFASLYLVSVFLLHLLFVVTKSDAGPKIGPLAYQLLAPFLFFIGGIGSWYILSKNSWRDDAKKFSAICLLVLFRALRMVTSIEETGKFSKSIVFLPFYLLRSIFILLCVVVKEIADGFFDFLGVVGIKR